MPESLTASAIDSATGSMSTHLTDIPAESMDLDHQPSTHADLWADIYDEVHLELSDPAHVDPVVDVLAELAGPGPALELGIGTGRIALPLAKRGIEVHGIDFSKAMIDKLRQKPGGEGIPVTLGYFSNLEVEGKYSLIFRGVQHILCSADRRIPGPMFPEGRSPFGPRRCLPDRGVRTTPHPP